MPSGIVPSGGMNLIVTADSSALGVGTNLIRQLTEEECLAGGVEEALLKDPRFRQIAAVGAAGRTTMPRR